MIQMAAENTVFPHTNSNTTPEETTRRRSTFYVPLTNDQCSLTVSLSSSNDNDGGINGVAADVKTSSTDKIYNPDLSACSFEWSLNESSDLLVGDEISSTKLRVHNSIEKTSHHSTPTKRDANNDIKSKSIDLSNVSLGQKKKRYGIVLNGISLDDDNDNNCDRVNDENTNKVNGDNKYQEPRSVASTPSKLLKSRSRSNILYFPEKSLQLSPLKEKSKTLPQNASPKMLSVMASDDSSNEKTTSGCAISVLPSKYSLLLKSSPKISINLLSSDNNSQRSSSHSKTSPIPATVTYSDQHKHMLSLSPSASSVTSPRKGLSFIRRAHSTKLSRSNSLLKSLTSKCVDQESGKLMNGNASICELQFEQFEKYFKEDNFYDLIREIFLKDLNSDCVSNNREKITSDEHLRGGGNATTIDMFDVKCSDADEVYSDTSYEKACRRGSAPSTPILNEQSSQGHQSTSRFTNFFTKRSNPLKRTKSVAKLERSKRGTGSLRGSRSHESLLSNHAVMSTIDLSCTGAVGVAPVHHSVLGRRFCFQVRGGPRGERYYSCGSRQERDLWIYSLRKSITPNAAHTRRTDNSLKMWIQEAKGIMPKKRYFCEINLDKTLYGRTSVKQKTDLLFWGEYFDFPDIPEINVITVNVFREGEKKKKRDKHNLVGSVKIPIHEVTKTTREFTEDWYPIISEKQDSISRNSSKDQIPTLRIKCRFQSIDILPVEIYTDFLQYLKANYKKICEVLEPVILVKPKEDIGQALVLLMHAHNMAAAYLTDVVALDLLRVDDQRLTFRGNSLATKSMEAFLKLTGEQYLQETLTAPITEIIASEKDFEVDPMKASGSLSRQQQALRNAVKSTWNSIAESHKNFPPQLRECFATFRERLVDLDREDMAYNLISASIFLRFLCPAILSPSLFNIKNELPTPRATRNLTLVAKTLQTLANFTRFQGKEDFMEFLNDFLELEAPRMNEFLHQISTRTAQPPTESVLDWAGYIDEGKQLAILHHLLSDNIQKISPNRQSELEPLQEILENITKAKNRFSLPMQQNQENVNTLTQKSLSEDQSNMVIKPLGNGERGIMRGVLTPSSLEKNIFCYNDPTVSPLLHQQQNQRNQQQQQLKINQSQSSLNGSSYSNPIQHSYSTSSISSLSNHNSQSLSATVHHHHHHNHAPSPERFHYIQQQQKLQQQQQQQQAQPQPLQQSQPPHKTNVYLTSSLSTPRNFNSTSQYYASNAVTNTRKNPAARASTLPRNNNIQIVNYNQEQPTLANAYSDYDQPYKSSNYIQIGFDTSSAFVRKSPTPMLKSSGQGSCNSSTRNLNANGSQLSLLSERALNQAARTTNTESNMPMKLEDLDDLLKYADEHAAALNKNNTHSNNGKEELSQKPSKSSSTSIGHCSSGYQSIATQSQSSTSPVDLPNALQSNGSEFNINITNNPNKIGTKSNKDVRRSLAKDEQQPTKYNSRGIQNSINTNFTNSISNPPLAFKNPLYQLQNAMNGIGGIDHIRHKKSHGRKHYSHHQASSITPSSSEERLHSMNDKYLMVQPANETWTSSSCSVPSDKENSLRSGGESSLSHNRLRQSASGTNMSRLNTSLQIKRDDINGNYNSAPRDRHHRYQRRLSLESARTLSDSSSDEEAVYIPKDGKRRRPPRSIEQCEREIKRLQSSLDTLRSQIHDDNNNCSDMGDHNSNDETPSTAAQPHSDIKMRNIIAKLISMEEELRREQLKMSLALSHKQRVIEAQGQQIAALDAANNRLLSALSSLRQRYENQGSGGSVSGQATSTTAELANQSTHC